MAMLANAGNLQYLHAHYGPNATVVALLASRISELPFSFTANARGIYHTYIDSDADDALRARKIASARFVTTISDYNREHLASLVAPETSHFL